METFKYSSLFSFLIKMNSRGINSIVIVFFVLILLVAAGIVFFSFTTPSQPPYASAVSPSVPVAGPDTGLPAPGASNVPVEAAKQCASSCDDMDACTKDFCNTVYGECDHEFMANCSAVPIAPAPVAVNSVPSGWCVPNELSSSLLPPYMNRIKPSLSGGDASLIITVSNPSESVAKDVVLSVFPSEGFELLGSASSVPIGDMPKYDAKDVSFAFKKQTGAVLGVSNPTYLKLSYTLSGKSAVLCSSVSFGEGQ